MTFKDFIIIVIVFTIAYALGYKTGKENNKTISSPVEEIIQVDSLIKANDSIKLKVEHLDSIKNAKVIEVSTLDNDSTLKLFYELVKE